MVGATILLAAASAHAAPVFNNFQVHACLGNTSTTTYVSGSNVTIFTTAPDFTVNLTTNAAIPSLNVNANGTAGPCGTSPVPAALPQISTAIGGLQGAYEFEANGNDSSVANNPLTLNGGCGFQPSAVAGMGQAWNPTGASCYGQATRPVNLGNTDFTIEAWIKVNGPPPGGADWPIVLDCASKANGQCLSAVLRNDGSGNYSPHMSFYGAELDANGQCGNSKVNDGKWHHIAFRDRSNVQYIFIDGILCGINPAILSEPAATLYVGGAPTTAVIVDSGAFANGDIDSLRIYNNALSDITIAAHARGQIYSLNFSETYNGNQSDTYCPAAAPGQPTFDWPWTFAAASHVFSSTVPTTVQFVAEDLAESIGSQSFVVNVNQVLLSTPPTPSPSNGAFDPAHSSTWTIGNFICDTTNTQYSVTTSWAGVQSVQGPNFLFSASGLTPNTGYGIKVTAAYTDSGGSGATITSNPSLFGYATTYANVPGLPNPSQSGPTAANVFLNLDGGVPPNNPGATNPSYTGIDVEGSADGGGTWTAYSGFLPFNGSNPRLLSNLPTSSKLIFRLRAQNTAGVVTAPGPVNSTATIITQPSRPTGFSGAPSTTPGFCGKTALHWSWNQVLQGSNGAPAGYVMFRATGTAANPACNGLISTTGCDEGGLTPVESVTNVVMASDTLTGLAFPLSLPSTATAVTAPVANPAPTSLAGTPLGGAIQWAWSALPYMCGISSYVVLDAVSGSTLTIISGSPPPAGWTQVPLGPNARSSIMVRGQDSFDPTGALSVSATAYSQAATPASLGEASVSTGSMVVSWSPNGNPSYTRYEFSRSTDGVNYAVLIAIGLNFTASTVPVAGLAPGSTYYFRVRAVNGSAADGGSTFTPYLAGAFMTLTTAPVLNPGVADPINPTTQIDWSWSDVGSVSRYDLIASTGGLVASILPPYGPTITVVETLPGPNMPATVQLIAYNGQGLGNASSSATFFTSGTPPTAAAAPILAVTTFSVTYTWLANGDPPGTLYEVNIATDPAYAVVIATFAAPLTTATVSGLLPATTYFARVRADGANGSFSAFLALGSTTTLIDPQVSVSSPPPSVYVNTGNLLGVWHFDESTGTRASDSSGFGNPALLMCAFPVPCASTPTWTSGPPGLGTSLAVSGQPGGYAQVADAPQYDVTAGSITVSAWVKPLSLSMPPNAGIVVKGDPGAEDFVLDVLGGRYEFGVRTAGGLATVLSNASVTLGAWTNLVGVFDGAAQQVRLYVNGVLDNTSALVVAPPRLVNAHPVSIGSRQSAVGGVYDKAFIGDIDEVRLLGQAFTAADAQANYQSAFISTVTLPPPNNGVFVAFAPDAFSGSVVIYATKDPFNHPLDVTPAQLAAGLSNAPTGQVLIPGSYLEIEPTLNDVPDHGMLGSSATIGLPLPDADGDGLVDGVSPPIGVQSLRVYTLNTTISQWTPLPTTIDTVNKLILTQTPHFSLFALFGAASIGASIGEARLYPNPWLRGSGGRYDAPLLTFDRLPQTGSIRIFTLSGQRVVELPVLSSNAGTATWDGRNAAGRFAASGVYFAQIEAAGGAAKLVKFAIER